MYWKYLLNQAATLQNYKINLYSITSELFNQNEQCQEIHIMNPAEKVLQYTLINQGLRMGIIILHTSPRQVEVKLFSYHPESA